MLIYTRLTTGHAMWDLTMSTNGALTGMVVSSTDIACTRKPCLLSYSQSSVFVGMNAFCARSYFGSWRSNTVCVDVLQVGPNKLMPTSATENKASAALNSVK